MTDHERLAREWAAEVRQSTSSRNKQIKALRRAGWSLRAIGEVVGLSHTAVKKIVDRET